MSRCFYCNECEEYFEVPTGDNCPKCGSGDVSVGLTFTDNISIKGQIQGKVKIPEQKKPTKEFKYGDDFCWKKNKFVNRTMVVDRANDTYDEKIVDTETGQVIHECHEPLKDHYGHGSAKERIDEKSSEK